MGERTAQNNMHSLGEELNYGRCHEVNKDRIVILRHSYLAQTAVLSRPRTMPRSLRNSSFVQCYRCANVSMLYVYKVSKNTKHPVTWPKQQFSDDPAPCQGHSGIPVLCSVTVVQMLACYMCTNYQKYKTQGR